jgi:hypothetical protein
MQIEHVNNIIDDCQDGHQVVEKLTKNMTPQNVHDAILDIKLNGMRYSKIKIIKLDTALTLIRNQL